MTSPRRAVLSVPANDARKLAKALGSSADEVVVDLEDAVAIDDKDAARAAVDSMSRRDHGSLAVRVNSAGTRWFDDDITACAANPAVDSIVLPKSESPDAVVELTARLERLEAQGRARLGLQLLLESPTGIHRAVELAAASDRVEALIIGYADLSASLGRRVEASWQFAQDAVLLAARMAGVQAIDGPLLTIADDEALTTAVTAAEALGFDGKWVIHPAQIGTVVAAFTPSDDDVAESHEILAVLAEAADAGRGACQWRGRMLDEAIAARARRILTRAGAR